MTTPTLVTADQAAGMHNVTEDFVLDLAKAGVIEVVGSFRPARGRAVPLFNSADVAKHVPKRVA